MAKEGIRELTYGRNRARLGERGEERLIWRCCVELSRPLPEVTTMMDDIQENGSNGETFHSFIFRPRYSSLLSARGIIADGTARMYRIESALIPPGRCELATTFIVGFPPHQNGIMSLAHDHLRLISVYGLHFTEHRGISPVALRSAVGVLDLIALIDARRPGSPTTNGNQPPLTLRFAKACTATV
ncbi:hypothetical protein K469DRAFT_398815 [Zopfia rhizophila CBS 207.26]|uniref:Uncharacterized protein n=1 Tax=Zopfia rhizophila CBS 207.26 TaxID=1314779 RepID=A0A6A6DE88_9PEZI|nr:hypothetical protein K469DRAFT_398815 [Zopfia rhizophila CBS 207.26]